MLARKYDNYAWEEEVELPQKKHNKRIDYNSLRNHLGILLGLLLAFYLLSVVRSEAYIRNGDNLMELKQQEASLIARNSEIKIEVDRLKSPERIASLAQQKLGMQVARSNIYVQANIAPTTKDGYAYAK